MTKDANAQELTPAQRCFVEALLLGGTVQAAGEKAGVSERTSRRWIKEPAVRAEIKRLQEESLDRVLRLASALGPQAIRVLGQAMQADAGPSVQVRAAQVLLTQLVALRQFYDLESRLQVLEEAAQARNGG